MWSRASRAGQRRQLPNIAAWGELRVAWFLHQVLMCGSGELRHAACQHGSSTVSRSCGSGCVFMLCIVWSSICCLAGVQRVVHLYSHMLRVQYCTLDWTMGAALLRSRLRVTSSSATGVTPLLMVCLAFRAPCSTCPRCHKWCHCPDTGRPAAKQCEQTYGPGPLKELCA